MHFFFCFDLYLYPDKPIASTYPVKMIGLNMLSMFQNFPYECCFCIDVIYVLLQYYVHVKREEAYSELSVCVS